MRSRPDGAGRRAAAAVAAAVATLLASGCYHIRTHEAAPPIGKPRALAKHVAAHLEKRDLRIGRTEKVLLLYDTPEVNPLERGEALCADLVPFWPYARGEWPAPEVPALGAVLEALLRPYFAGSEGTADGNGPGDGEPDLALELSFTPDTYRRFTRTRYGLSIYGWIASVLGYPTSFATTRLEADLRILDARHGEPGAQAIFERRVASVQTLENGTFLFFFHYNVMQKFYLLYGPPPVRWDDITAEAIEDFADELLDALEEAFPLRCMKCRIDYESGAKRCEKCGGEIIERSRS